MPTNDISGVRFKSLSAASAVWMTGVCLFDMLGEVLIYGEKRALVTITVVPIIHEESSLALITEKAEPPWK